MLLVVTSYQVEGAPTHCTPDGAGNGKAMSMASVVSSASTRAADVTETAKVEKTAVKVEIAQTTTTPSNPATAGGGVAGGGDDGSMGDGAGTAPGVHKRGLRWQSFLPGVIK